VAVGPSSVHATAVLFNGTKDGACCRDLVCVGSPNVALGQVRWDDYGCSGRDMAVFAPGRGPFRQAYPSSIPATVALPEPGVVVAKLWVVAKQAEVQAILARGAEDFSVAAERLDALASGVRLKLVRTAGIATDGADGALADVIGDRCGVVTRSVERDKTAPTALGRYFATSDTLNVYYVDGVAPECPAANPDCYGQEGSGSSEYLHGVSCASEDPQRHGDPEILFVSGQLASRAETLLHEIGHSLGLIRPASGHTNLLADFPERAANLMYDGANVVENITVGQLWRLHYEPTSWLFPRAGLEMPFAACQADPRDDVPCPPLALRPSQPWP
jgi:hypothetical protein